MATALPTTGSTKRYWWWLVAFLLLLVSGLAWQAWQTSQEPQYLTQPVTRGNIEQTVSAVGILQPLQYVDVGTQVTGQLKTLHVDIGAQVKAKDLLAEIDTTLFLAKVEGAQASLRSGEAQLQDRQAQWQLAKLDYARNQELFAQHATSQETLERSHASLQQAAAQVTAAQAQVALAKSQLALDQANLRYTKIYAPMTGTVVSLSARQGQTLVASQAAPTIMRIADLNTMTIWAQTSEADVPKVKLGMPVYFNTLGQPERRWESRVRQIYPTPETLNNVVLYDVLFDVSNPDLALKPQMSTQVYFVLDKAEDVLLVPIAALQGNKPMTEKHRASAKAVDKTSTPARPSKGNKPSVYSVKVLKDGKIEVRQVTIGITTRISAQVLAGLAEGELVVIGNANASNNNAKSTKSAAPLGANTNPGGMGRP